MSPGSYDDYYWLQYWVHNDYCMTDLANNQKYTTAMFQICRRNSRWNPATVDVSKITRLEVLDNGKYVIGRVVLKEPSSAVSISIILQTAVINLKRCSEWNLEVESQSGIKKWAIEVECQSGIYLKHVLPYKPEYYVNIWDPWMMDSFKTTSSVLGKRSIPADLINMIQDFTHFEDQHID